jgi:hypothetical protein
VSTILSDELLSELMAVGQVDVLVGLPTLNHSDSVGAAVRAAHLAFNRELSRERTVLLNVDGGSTDGTPDIVRDASIVDRETLLASHSLRTRHRISAPYHGVPGKATALRVVFAAADLLQARALVVLDPEIASVSAESVTALARPALAAGADFVSPAYARHPLEGLLVTQVVRPLFRGAFGLALQEPLAGELGCSSRFAARDALRLAADLWLWGMAASDGMTGAEAGLGPRRLTPRPRPAVATLVPQILDALFTCLRLQEGRWTVRSRPVPMTRVATPRDSAEPATVDVEGYALLFREGLSALSDLLKHALRPTTLEALESAAAVDGVPPLPDELWTSVLLVRAAVPLYLGRAASFAAEVAGVDRQTADRRLEALCVQLERSRDELVALWTGPAR